jgi:ParB/RepB/Spo0J family partition protein
MKTANSIERVLMEFIDVKDNPLRPVNGEEVKRLAASMERIGLMTPITVRYHEDRSSVDGERDDSYELIAGRHRLAAAKSLGWDEIDAIEIDCSDTDARLWEIAENLHRAELTKLQRDEQVAEWIRLTDEISSQVETKSVGRPKAGINAAARDLGVERNDAHRAVKVASLSDEAKQAAVEHGLDDNRSVLLEAAKEKDPKDQVKKIVARAKKEPVVEEPSDDDNESESFLVPSDVAGSEKANRMIEKILNLFESIDLTLDKWLDDADNEAKHTLLQAIDSEIGPLYRRVNKSITKQRKENDKTYEAYGKQFGYCYGVLDSARVKLMQSSLTSGVDKLAEVKRLDREYAEKRQRDHEEFLRQPCTPEMEQEYTALIKNRALYEGACELSWAQYFRYRDEHPDCTRLDDDDLIYAGMWTSCAVREVAVAA